MATSWSRPVALSRAATHGTSTNTELFSVISIADVGQQRRTYAQVCPVVNGPSRTSSCNQIRILRALDKGVCDQIRNQSRELVRSGRRWCSFAVTLSLTVLTVDYHGHVWSVVDGDEVYGATS